MMSFIITIVTNQTH